MKKVDAEAVIAALDQGSAGVDVTEMAAEMMTAFGGARKFAQDYYREFAGTKVGSISRAKMLEGVLRVVSTAKAKANPLGNTNDMSEDELKAYLVALLSHLTQTPDDHAAPQAEQPGEQGAR